MVGAGEDPDRDVVVAGQLAEEAPAAGFDRDQRVALAEDEEQRAGDVPQRRVGS